MARGGQIRKENPSTFAIRSQSDPTIWHEVQWRGKSWRCDCKPDSDNSSCYHINALILFLSLPQILMKNLDPDSHICPNCGYSMDNAAPTGFQKNKSGLVQRYRCNNCGYRFNDRDGFSRLKSNPALIVVATNLFLLGLSTRQIKGHLLDVYGNAVDHTTIYRWVSRYMKLLAKLEKKLVAMNRMDIGNKWHVDEMKIKVKGRIAYVWSIIDHKTRYLLACQVSRSRGSNMAENVINIAVRRFGKVPEEIVSDGLSSYITPIRNLNDKKTGSCRARRSKVKHIAGRTFQDKVNNNLIERFNRTLRRRARVADKFEDIHSAGSFVAGFGAYYNLLRPHLGLQDKTPADKAKMQKPCSLVHVLKSNRASRRK